MRGGHKRLTLAGFSLLEVIAALVILSLGASAAFTWLSQTVQTLSRLREQEAMLLARQEVLEYLHGINPLLQPRGDVHFADYEVIWTSEPVAPVMRAQAGAGAAALYEVGLHEVKVVVRRADTDWFTIAQPVAGFRQVAAANATTPFGRTTP